MKHHHISPEDPEYKYLYKCTCGFKTHSGLEFDWHIEESANLLFKSDGEKPELTWPDGEELDYTP